MNTTELSTLKKERKMAICTWIKNNCANAIVIAMLIATITTVYRQSIDIEILKIGSAKTTESMSKLSDNVTEVKVDIAGIKAQVDQIKEMVNKMDNKLTRYNRPVSVKKYDDIGMSK